MANPPLQWLRHTSDLLGLSLDVPSEASKEEGSAGDFRYFLAQTEPVQIGAWAGPGQDLAAWRNRLNSRKPQFGAEVPATLCARPARLQEAAVEADRATGVFRDSAGRMGHLEHRVPAQVHVAIAGQLPDGTAVLISWSVAADRREAYRADEQRFIASISCR